MNPGTYSSFGDGGTGGNSTQNVTNNNSSTNWSNSQAYGNLMENMYDDYLSSYPEHLQLSREYLSNNTQSHQQFASSTFLLPDQYTQYQPQVQSTSVGDLSPPSSPNKSYHQLQPSSYIAPQSYPPPAELSLLHPSSESNNTFHNNAYSNVPANGNSNQYFANSASISSFPNYYHQTQSQTIEGSSTAPAANFTETPQGNINFQYNFSNLILSNLL